MFAVLWARDTEDAKEHELGGIRLRNYPLQYWVEYVRHLGNPESPVLILQSKCDEQRNEVHRFPIAADTLDVLDYCKQLHYSAKNNRGRAALDEAMREAVNWLRDPERGGTAMIGAGRMRVQRRLEAMREADGVLKPALRKHRTLTRDRFRRICQEEKDVSSPEYLLDYLHNSGIVFYRPGLFDDRIVLDQAWALDAIYAIFNRETCYRQLRYLRGRFTRSLLNLLVWRAYGLKEQELFLSMMVSCGICFVHREGNEQEGRETEYIAPNLLPERREVEMELEEKWRAGQTIEALTFEYPLLHPGLMRGVTARIGGDAGINGLYWRGGLCVYETNTRSHALIEQEMSSDWTGIIRVQTQGGQATNLIGIVAKVIERENLWSGLRPQRKVQPNSQAHNNERVAREQVNETKERERKAEYGPTPKQRSEW